MKHTISVMVENKPGVLARIAGLFSARGYNISSLAVSETLDPCISYMTMVVEAVDEKVLEQIKKQLNKLIDVIKVTDFTKKEHVERELILVKVECPEKEMAKLEHLIKKYMAKVIQHGQAAVIIEAVDEEVKVRQLLEGLSQFTVKELIRTGKIAMAK